MGSYALSYMLGLYPLPGTKQYLLSSPYFRKISITNPVLKKTTTFIANNFTGNPGDGIGGNVFVKVCCSRGFEEPWSDSSWHVPFLL